MILGHTIIFSYSSTFEYISLHTARVPSLAPCTIRSCLRLAHSSLHIFSHLPCTFDLPLWLFHSISSLDWVQVVALLQSLVGQIISTPYGHVHP